MVMYRPAFTLGNGLSSSIEICNLYRVSYTDVLYDYHRLHSRYSRPPFPTEKVATLLQEILKYIHIYQKRIQSNKIPCAFSQSHGLLRHTPSSFQQLRNFDPWSAAQHNLDLATDGDQAPSLGLRNWLSVTA